MQILTSTLGRLAMVLTGALALGSCNRAEYATLPRSASYLGSTTVASVPRAAAPVATPKVATPTVEVATTPTAVAPLASAPVAAAPTATTTPIAAAPAVAAKPAAAAASPAKLNLVQRLALAKITKKLDKLAAKSPQFKQHDAAASTARIDGNLRTGIVLLLVGLLVGIFNGVIGTIIALIGVVFIVLWLLDSL